MKTLKITINEVENNAGIDVIIESPSLHEEPLKIELRGHFAENSAKKLKSFLARLP